MLEPKELRFVVMLYFSLSIKNAGVCSLFIFPSANTFIVVTAREIPLSVSVRLTF